MACLAERAAACRVSRRMNAERVAVLDRQRHVHHFERLAAIVHSPVGDARRREHHPQRERDAAQLLSLGPVKAAKIGICQPLGVVGMQTPSDRPLPFGAKRLAESGAVDVMRRLCERCQDRVVDIQVDQQARVRYARRGRWLTKS